MDKLKVCFIKFGGLATGGTERFLHTIAASLPKDKFDVDFYYTDSAPYLGSNWIHPNTDPERKEYLEKSGVKLIRVEVQYKDVRTPTHEWINTNLWDLFDEKKYNILIIGRAGHREFPFYHIKTIPIIDILTLNAGVDNQENIYKTIHLSKWSGEVWAQSGGNREKLEIIPIIQIMPEKKQSHLKKDLGIENKFVYGFHQRDSDGLFSEVPLLAYKMVEDEGTCFLLLGGSNEYSNQANTLGIKNFIQLPHTGNAEYIHSFLSTLDVFTHGRNDGETFGTVFTEAMFHKKPCISHKSSSNGHIEVIGDGGFVLERNNIQGYAELMLKLKNDTNFYNELSQKGYNHYLQNFSYETQIDKIIKIIYDGVKEFGQLR